MAFEKNSADESSSKQSERLPVTINQAAPAQRAASIAIGAMKATWAFSKKVAIDLNNRRIEARRAGQIEKFQRTFEELATYKDLINPGSWQTISTYANDVANDSEALARFAEHTLIQKLLEYAKRREAFVKYDLARQKRTHAFEVDCDGLFSAIGYAIADPVMRSIAGKYKVSNVGNSIAAGIFAGRKNYGAAAYTMAESARVGANNGDANVTFTNHMKYLIFTRPAANMTELHQKYAVYAFRLRFMSIGDASIVGRAMFSLVYDNGHAAAKPPKPHNRFSGNLHAEFHNNVLPHIWTAQQAAANLDEIRKASDRNEKLFHASDIRPFLRSFKDEVPKPGFHLASR
jgi:hypothetical protein